MTYAQIKERHCLATDRTEGAKGITYNPDLAPVIALVMAEINARVHISGCNFSVQHMLEKGLKIFRPKGKVTSAKEIKQLHTRACFTPTNISKLNPIEIERAIEALIFLMEKCDKTIKGRMVYNRKKMRKYLSCKETASPTALLESIFLTAIINAKEGRDMMMKDILNTFIQAAMPPPKENEDPVIMKITGVQVHMLIETVPKVYGDYVVMENRNKEIYLQVLQALYRMSKAALLWYKIL